MFALLGQTLQHGREEDRLVSFLQNSKVDEEDDVQCLRVLQGEKRKEKGAANVLARSKM